MHQDETSNLHMFKFSWILSFEVLCDVIAVYRKHIKINTVLYLQKWLEEGEE